MRFDGQFCLVTIDSNSSRKNLVVESNYWVSASKFLSKTKIFQLQPVILHSLQLFFRRLSNEKQRTRVDKAIFRPTKFLSKNHMTSTRLTRAIILAWLFIIISDWSFGSLYSPRGIAEIFFSKFIIWVCFIRSIYRYW